MLNKNFKMILIKQHRKDHTSDKNLSMIAFQDYFNESLQERATYTTKSATIVTSNNNDGDPLQLEQVNSFPFPDEAAKTLADLRSQRFDPCDLAIEEAEMRIREFASMMGLYTLHDDPPSAA